MKICRTCVYFQKIIEHDSALGITTTLNELCINKNNLKRGTRSTNGEHFLDVDQFDYCIHWRPKTKELEGSRA